VFAPFTDKKAGADANQLWAEHGKPLVFADGTRGLRLNVQRLALEVADVVGGDVSKILIHDRTSRALAHMLVEMPFGPFVMALGVLYDDPAPTFDEAVATQNAQASVGKSPDLQRLLSQGQTWIVDKQPRGV